jgi:hypothetical protein
MAATSVSRIFPPPGFRVLNAPRMDCAEAFARLSSCVRVFARCANGVDVCAWTASLMRADTNVGAPPRECAFHLSAGAEVLEISRNFCAAVVAATETRDAHGVMLAAGRFCALLTTFDMRMPLCPTTTRADFDAKEAAFNAAAARVHDVFPAIAATIASSDRVYSLRCAGPNLDACRGASVCELICVTPALASVARTYVDLTLAPS